MAYLDRHAHGADAPEAGGMEDTAMADEDRASRRGRLIRFGLAGFLLAVLAGGVWQAYAGDGPEENGVVPVILAEPGEARVIPENRRGLIVPHQGIEIYSQIEEANRERVEAAAQEAREQAEARAREEAQAALEAAEAAEREAEQARQAAAERRRQQERARASSNGYTPPPRRQYRSMAEAIGPYRIQMGAFRTPEAAFDRWQVLSRRHSDLLRNLDLIIERHDGSNGRTVYRLQAGPLRTPDEVNGLCEQLELRRIRCALVEV